MQHDPSFYRHLIGALWLAWALYWLVSAFNTKVTQRREPLGSRLAYVLPLIVAAVLLGWRHLPWGPLLAMRLWPRSFALYWTGVALLAAGLLFAVWARVHLGRNWSGTGAVKEGSGVIRSGPPAPPRPPAHTGL